VGQPHITGIANTFFLNKIDIRKVRGRKMAKDSAVLDSGGRWFHHWGARTEKSLNWAEWELPTRRVGKDKGPEVAEGIAQVGV
jgi:hypothetical protein